MRTLGAHRRRPRRMKHGRCTRPHIRLELRVRARIRQRLGGPDDVPVPGVHSEEALHRFDGFFEGEDVKVGGEECRVDGRCCEGVRGYQLDGAALVEDDGRWLGGAGRG